MWWQQKMFYDDGAPLEGFSHTMTAGLVPAYHCGERGYARAQYTGGEYILLCRGTRIMHVVNGASAYTRDFIRVESDDIQRTYDEIAFGMLYFGGRRNFAELYEEENKRAMRGEGGDHVPHAYRDTVPTLSRRPLPAELVIPSNAYANSVSVLSAGGLLTVRDSQITINYEERIDIYPFKGPLNPRIRFYDGVIGLAEGAQRLYMYYGIDVRGLRGIDVCNKLLAMTSRRGEYSEVFALLPQPIAEEINHFYGRIVFFVGKKTMHLFKYRSQFHVPSGLQVKLGRNEAENIACV
jgi:hypothetical protein